MDTPLDWPTEDPTYGGVRLRAFDPRFEEQDVAAALDLASDPYVVQVTTLPERATAVDAREWVVRQRGRLAEGIGFCFCICDEGRGSRPSGYAALWVAELGAGRAHAGYGVAPSARGHHLAADALTALTYARLRSDPA